MCLPCFICAHMCAHMPHTRIQLLRHVQMYMCRKSRSVHAHASPVHDWNLSSVRFEASINSKTLKHHNPCMKEALEKEPLPQLRRTLCQVDAFRCLGGKGLDVRAHGVGLQALITMAFLWRFRVAAKAMSFAHVCMLRLCISALVGEGRS